MSFFSLILSERNKIKHLLPEYQFIYDEIDDLIDKPDIKTFVDKSLNGKLYELMAVNLEMTRKDSKMKMFLTLFSDDKQSPKTKKKLSEFLPNVVNICNILNSNKRKLIPKLCQILESRIMIQHIAIPFLTENEHPFYTVHDSFNVHVDDKDNIIRKYNNFFNKLNIKPLKIKTK